MCVLDGITLTVKLIRRFGDSLYLCVNIICESAADNLNFKVKRIIYKDGNHDLTKIKKGNYKTDMCL